MSWSVGQCPPVTWLQQMRVRREHRGVSTVYFVLTPHFQASGHVFFKVQSKQTLFFLVICQVALTLLQHLSLRSFRLICALEKYLDVITIRSSLGLLKPIQGSTLLFDTYGVEPGQWSSKFGCSTVDFASTKGPLICRWRSIHLPIGQVLVVIRPCIQSKSSNVNDLHQRMVCFSFKPRGAANPDPRTWELWVTNRAAANLGCEIYRGS